MQRTRFCRSGLRRFAMACFFAAWPTYACATTATPTGTATSTPCSDVHAPFVMPVTSPTSELTQIITGILAPGRYIFVRVCSEAGCGVMLLPDEQVPLHFAVTVPLWPNTTNHLEACAAGHCLGEACIRVADIVQVEDMSTATRTPTPAVTASGTPTASCTPSVMKTPTATPTRPTPTRAASPTPTETARQGGGGGCHLGPHPPGGGTAGVASLLAALLLAHWIRSTFRNRKKLHEGRRSRGEPNISMQQTALSAAADAER